ncbi:MAG: hypothetical protein PHO01_08250 [Desulfotomaculaceae bacterium]|nr:hypothetical protein [Desulfotomaculaceae bacterium]
MLFNKYDNNSECKVDYKIIVEMLREMGYNVIYGILPEGDAIYRVDEKTFIVNINLLD